MKNIDVRKYIYILIINIIIIIIIIAQSSSQPTCTVIDVLNLHMSSAKIFECHQYTDML